MREQPSPAGVTFNPVMMGEMMQRRAKRFGDHDMFVLLYRQCVVSEDTSHLFEEERLLRAIVAKTVRHKSYVFWVAMISEMVTGMGMSATGANEG